jgi:hypothetical protein
VTKA